MNTHRLLANTYSIRVITLLAALFIGHLVKVNAVSVVPQCLGGPVLASDWHAIREQYDPTYIDRLQISCPPAATPAAASDWHAVREQYDPTYIDRLQINGQPTTLIVVPDWRATREQYEGK